MCNRETLLDAVKKQAKWNQEDAYPSSEEWKNEDNKLLEFAREENQLNCYEHRLKTDNKSRRDETLAELRAAYFLVKGCGMSIKEWHPQSGRGDFIISFGEENIFCEVKSPGWEGEIAKEYGSNALRFKQQKYISGEARFFDDSRHIMGTIEKAYKKFPEDMSTMLICVDDFWVDSFDDQFCIYRALHYEKLRPPYEDERPEGAFVDKRYMRLGGTLFIKLDLEVSRGFVWKIHIAKNENASPTVELPNDFINAVKSVRKIDNNLVEIYTIKRGLLEKD